VREEDADEAKRVIAESQRAGSSMGESSADSAQADDDATAELPTQE